MRFLKCVEALTNSDDSDVDPAPKGALWGRESAGTESSFRHCDGEKLEDI